MKKITTAQYRSMPWKNGAGTTVEMAVFPQQAFISNFEWRVSRAAVMSDGGFSQFEGVDRSLALLHGRGIRLNIADKTQQLDASNNIAAFSGDATTHAELLDGPITDFNVMSRRDRCTHLLSLWVGDAKRTLPNECVLLYCARGSGTLVHAPGSVELHEDETVIFTAEDVLESYTMDCSADSRFYCVQIFNQTSV